MKKAELEAILLDAIRLDDRQTRNDVIDTIPVDNIITYLEDCGYAHAGDHIADPSMSYWERNGMRLTFWPMDPSSCLESIARHRGVTTLRVLLEVLHGEDVPGIKKL
jgi:hypothetical protein